MRAPTQKSNRPKSREDLGFALPLVLIVGLIMTVGGFAMLARSFGGLIGSSRLEQARQAKAIAEAGLAKTVEALNRKHNYLLTNCYSQSGSAPPPNDCISTGTWIQPSFPSSICPNVDNSSTPSLSETINAPNGEYVIDYYAYSGTQFYGGTGRLRVIGYRKNSDNSKILASAAVEMSFDVKPKPCGARYDAPPTSSGFPGLMASKITMGGNDVIGKTSGNILCTQCIAPAYEDTDEDGVISSEEYSKQNEPIIGCNEKCDVGGSVFIGEVDIPSIPDFPTEDIDEITNISDIDLQDGSITITAASTTGLNNNNRCATKIIDSKPATYCKIKNIRGYGNNTLTINSTAGPIKLYISEDVSLVGKSGIIHDGDSKDLSLYGLPMSADSRCSSQPDFTLQNIKISGGSQGSNLFAFFPCGTAGIYGGSKFNCDDASDDNCAGGDIRGAVWAKEWKGSSGNQAQLVVPPDLPSDLTGENGPSFAISVRDYVALGVNSWLSFKL